MKLYILFSMLLASMLGAVNAADMEQNTFGKIVDETGAISLPTNYRDHWAHMGSWMIPDPKAPGHGFHDVYTQPETALHYQRTSTFPDGAVIIKEVRAVEKGPKTTGEAHWAGATNIWFVMIKDAKGRFKNNLHWSEGWGWALFENKKDSMSAGMTGGMSLENKSTSFTNVSQGFKESCQGCHLPAKAKDWVFIEGYPTLTE